VFSFRPAAQRVTLLEQREKRSGWMFEVSSKCAVNSSDAMNMRGGVQVSRQADESPPRWHSGGVKTICVYRGATSGNRPEFLCAARELGRLLAERGIALVYGDGHVGLMGVVAEAVPEGDGHVTGVIPRSMVEKVLAHE
jgi:hypothetical protein